MSRSGSSHSSSGGSRWTETTSTTADDYFSSRTSEDFPQHQPPLRKSRSRPHPGMGPSVRICLVTSITSALCASRKLNSRSLLSIDKSTDRRPSPSMSDCQYQEHRTFHPLFLLFLLCPTLSRPRSPPVIDRTLPTHSSLLPTSGRGRPKNRPTRTARHIMQPPVNTPTRRVPRTGMLSPGRARAGEALFPVRVRMSPDQARVVSVRKA